MKFTKLLDELKDHLRLERAQTTNEYAVVLCVMSSASVLCVNGLSSQVANAVINVARLLP